jgi:hypothetical protein
MSDLDRIMKKYAAFEKRVQKQIIRRLGPYCAECEGSCCTATICRESTESPFLVRLRKVYQPDVRYQKRRGWQRKNGCALEVGRPPICYEFICNDIERDHAAPLDRYMVKVLCRVISHTGVRADGPLHLVDITNESDLEAVSYQRFTKRLGEAEEAFKLVRSFYAGKEVKPETFPALARIHPLPPSLKKKRR